MTENDQIAKIIAVSNTGPMVSAFQCGRTDLLKRYFSLIYITASELDELHAHGWLDEVDQLVKEGFVAVEELTDSEKKQAEVLAKRIAQCQKSANSDWHNDLAEAEAMVLMQNRIHLDIAIILLDEKAARQVASQLGLNLISSLFASLVNVALGRKIRTPGKITPEWGFDSYSHGLQSVADGAVAIVRSVVRGNAL